jgi:hypothetical protein
VDRQRKTTVSASLLPLASMEEEDDFYPHEPQDFPKLEAPLSAQGGLEWLMDLFGWGPARKSRISRDEIAAKADKRYESMTPQQRDRYYVHPSLWKRFLQFWRL